MTKLKILCFLCLLGLASHLWAARMIPDTMRVAMLNSASGQTVVLSANNWTWLRILSLGLFDTGKNLYHMNASVRIRNQQNLFVTYNQLPRFLGEAVAVRFDSADNIDEIWILTPDELKQLQARAVYIEQQRKL